MSKQNKCSELTKTGLPCKNKTGDNGICSKHNSAKLDTNNNVTDDKPPKKTKADKKESVAEDKPAKKTKVDKKETVSEDKPAKKTKTDKKESVAENKPAKKTKVDKKETVPVKADKQETVSEDKPAKKIKVAKKETESEDKPVKKVKVAKKETVAEDKPVKKVKGDKPVKKVKDVKKQSDSDVELDDKPVKKVKNVKKQSDSDMELDDQLSKENNTIVVANPIILQNAGNKVQRILHRIMHTKSEDDSDMENEIIDDDDIRALLNAHSEDSNIFAFESDSDNDPALKLDIYKNSGSSLPTYTAPNYCNGNPNYETLPSFLPRPATGFMTPEQEEATNQQMAQIMDEAMGKIFSDPKLPEIIMRAIFEDAIKEKRFRKERKPVKQVKKLKKANDSDDDTDSEEEEERRINEEFDEIKNSIILTAEEKEQVEEKVILILKEMDEKELEAKKRYLDSLEEQNTMFELDMEPCETIEESRNRDLGLTMKPFESLEESIKRKEKEKKPFESLEESIKRKEKEKKKEKKPKK
jgi:hypothetical protein